MKNKTYRILTRIPVIGAITKCVVDNPALHCTPMLNDGLPTVLLDYMKQHPDEHITRGMVKKILKGNK